MATTFNLNIEKTLLAANESTTFTLTFDSRVIGLTQKNFIQEGVTVSDFITTDGITFTGTLTANEGFNGAPTLYIRAASYRNGEDYSPGSLVSFDLLFIDSTLPLAPEITLPDAGADGIYNKDEVNDNGTVTATIKLPTSDNKYETTKPGDILTINGEEITITQDMIDNGYQVEVKPGTEPTDITASIRDKAGNVGEATAEEVPAADLSIPEINISIDSVTEDDVINSEEAQQDIAITGVVTGEFNTGDEVSLIVNNSKYIGNIDAQGKFSINVAGSDLAADSGRVITAHVATTNAVGNTSNANADRSYMVDIQAPDAPTVIIADGDDIISEDEINDKGEVQVTIRLPDGLEVGDRLIVNGSSLTIGADQLEAGEIIWQFEAPDVGQALKVDAYISDVAGNLSETASASATTAIVTVAPIFLGHLGYHLTETQGPENHYGKKGQDINYLTTEFNDQVYIGYSGFNQYGRLIRSRLDGDFERDRCDGEHIWVMDTGSGDDFVKIRNNQNAYTVTKLGAGNDTIWIGGALNSDVRRSSKNADARSYIFTESGDDTINIQGYSSNCYYDKASIVGGRIFAGSGSDKIYIKGSVVKGAVIDLGSGNTYFANSYEAAKSADIFTDINTLRIDGALGGRQKLDYGYIQGGAGQDNVTIKGDVNGYSIVDLGDNNDKLTVKSIKDNTSVNMGDGNDVVTVNCHVTDNADIQLGQGDDMLVIKGDMYHYATIDAGNGDDTIIINSLYNSAKINMGEGNDSLFIKCNFGKGEGRAYVDMGAGDDVITFGGSYIDGLIQGGVGIDTLILTSNASSGYNNISTKHFKGIEKLELQGDIDISISYYDLVNDTGREGNLFVNGDSGNTLNIDLYAPRYSQSYYRYDQSNARGWEKVGTELVDGTVYNVYHHTNAGDEVRNDLYIEQGITVI